MAITPPGRHRPRRQRGGGRRAKLAPDSPLFAEVAKLLRLQWSPEQIAGRRKRLEDGTEVSSGLRVSHEAIFYQAIYAVPRGELRVSVAGGRHCVAARYARG